MKKNIETILKGSPFGMVGDGFRVSNYFPNGNKPERKISPFILLDYHPSYYYSPVDKPRGVGVHPHRGFETITLAFKGAVAHHDSHGGAGIIYEGDVQWMTAASGVLHKEYHEENFAKAGGNMQMLQLWVNLPAKNKMDTPHYQAIANADMPKVSLENNSGIVEVIAGEYKENKGPAKTYTPINMYRVYINKNGIANFRFNQNHNTGFLITKGKLVINEEKEVSEMDFVLFNHSGTDISVKAIEDAEFIVLDGQLIDEPVVQYGPFVMNKPEEINEAIDDFRNGKFGELADD